MIEIKLDSKLTSRIQDVLEPYAARLGRLDETVMAIVELTTVRRTDVSPELVDKGPAAQVRITLMEVATRDQEPHLRTAQEAMYKLRTARGTLDEMHSTEDANRQLRLLGNMLADGDGD